MTSKWATHAETLGLGHSWGRRVQRMGFGTVPAMVLGSREVAASLAMGT